MSLVGYGSDEEEGHGHKGLGGALAQYGSDDDDDQKGAQSGGGSNASGVRKKPSSSDVILHTTPVMAPATASNAQLDMIDAEPALDGMPHAPAHHRQTSNNGIATAESLAASERTAEENSLLAQNLLPPEPPGQPN